MYCDRRGHVAVINNDAECNLLGFRPDHCRVRKRVSPVGKVTTCGRSGPFPFASSNDVALLARHADAPDDDLQVACA